MENYLLNLISSCKIIINNSNNTNNSNINKNNNEILQLQLKFEEILQKLTSSSSSFSSSLSSSFSSLNSIPLNSDLERHFIKCENLFKLLINEINENNSSSSSSLSNENYQKKSFLKINSVIEDIKTRLLLIENILYTIETEQNLINSSNNLNDSTSTSPSSSLSIISSSPPSISFLNSNLQIINNNNTQHIQNIQNENNCNITFQQLINHCQKMKEEENQKQKENCDNPLHNNNNNNNNNNGNNGENNKTQLDIIIERLSSIQNSVHNSSEISEILRHLSKCNDSFTAWQTHQTTKTATVSRRKSLLDDIQTRLLLIENSIQDIIPQNENIIQNTPTGNTSPYHNHNNHNHNSHDKNINTNTINTINTTNNYNYLHQIISDDCNSSNIRLNPAETPNSNISPINLSASSSTSSSEKILISVPPLPPSTLYIWDERLSELSFLSEHFLHQSFSSFSYETTNNQLLSLSSSSPYLSLSGWDLIVDPVVITGVAGVGKSALALEFTHIALNKQSYEIIRWMDMDEVHLTSTWKQFGRDLCLDVDLLSSSEIIQSVISIIKRSKTLLIFDNVESFNDISQICHMINSNDGNIDSHFINESLTVSSETLFTPHIIITTRNKQHYHNNFHILTIDKFSKDLIEKYYKNNLQNLDFSIKMNHERYLDYLYTAFSGLPILITTSISFINTINNHEKYFNKKISLEEFYNLYRKQKQSLKTKYEDYLHRYDSTTQQLMRLWCMIRDQIEKSNNNYKNSIKSSTSTSDLSSSNLSILPTPLTTSISSSSSSFSLSFSSLFEQEKKSIPIVMCIPVMMRLCCYGRGSIPLSIVLQYCNDDYVLLFECIKYLYSFSLITIPNEIRLFLEQCNNVDSNDPINTLDYPLLTGLSIYISPLIQLSIYYEILLSIFKSREEVYDENNIEIIDISAVIDVSLVYQYIGQIYQRYGSNNEALKLYTKSLQIKERLHNENLSKQKKDNNNTNSNNNNTINTINDNKDDYSDRLNHEADIAQLHHDIGTVLCTLEQYDLSYIHLTKSLELNLQLFGTKNCWEYTSTELQLGILYALQQKYYLALDIFQTLLLKELHDVNMRNTILSYIDRINEILGEESSSKLRYREAIQYYSECLIIKRNLHRNNSEIVHILTLLYKLHNNAGHEYIQCGDFKNGLRQYYEGYKSILKRHDLQTTEKESEPSDNIMDIDENILHDDIEISNQLELIGSIRYKQKKYKKSLKLYKNSLQIKNNLLKQLETKKGDNNLILNEKKMLIQDIQSLQYRIYYIQLQSVVYYIIMGLLFLGVIIYGYLMANGDKKSKTTPQMK